MISLVQELEDAVVDAWPATECVELDGWCLRASGGPSRRANSVATLGAGSGVPLPERIVQAETFYRERGLLPMFQIGPAATPVGLDATLAERGYRIVGESLAAAADPSEVVSRLPRGTGGIETSVGTSASEAWLQHAGRSGRFADSYELWLNTLKLLGTRCRFVTARDGRGTVTGTCLGIASEQRLGVYAMLTNPGQRRKGTGAALLRALAECALAERMSELYLLVELDNESARALYSRAGFAEVYRYHYRVLEMRPLTDS